MIFLQRSALLRLGTQRKFALVPFLGPTVRTVRSNVGSAFSVQVKLASASATVLNPFGEQAEVARLADAAIATPTRIADADHRRASDHQTHAVAGQGARSGRAAAADGALWRDRAATRAAP